MGVVKSAVDGFWVGWWGVRFLRVEGLISDFQVG